MARQHFCPDYPDQSETSDGWRDGGVDQCSYHGSKLSTLTPVRMGAGDRRKADKAAGVIGQDRGSYINSPDQGR